MTTSLIAAAVLAVAVAAPAQAQEKEIGYPEGSLAYEALMNSNYALAEKQLRADKRVPARDPARLMNLGLVLANTGDLEGARRAFNQILSEDEIELIMSDGSTQDSHDAARRSLAMLK